MRHDPVWYVEIFAPPSIDPTEATILTPSAGALHSDPCRLTTGPGIPGYQPYLMPLDPRLSKITPKTKATDIGSVTLRVGNPRIASLDDDAKRWFDQFLGDDNGRDAINGCKVVVSLSLRGGSPEVIYTGRIKTADQQQLITYTIPTRDLMEDVKSQLFVTAPHSSIAYAFRSSLQPLGLPQAWGDFPATPARKGRALAAGRVSCVPGGDEHVQAILTKELLDQATAISGLGVNDPLQPTISVILTVPSDRLLVWVRRNDTGAVGYFKPTQLTVLRGTDRTHWELNAFLVETAPAFTGGMAYPTNQNITWRLYPAGPVSEQGALFIGPVHPWQLAKDALLGKFGPIDDTGTALDVLTLVTDSFDDLIAQQFESVMFKETEAADRKEWLTKNVWPIVNGGIIADPDGRIRAVDVRGSLPVGALDVIDGTMLQKTASELGWSSVGDDAITNVAATHSTDTRVSTRSLQLDPEEFPSVPAGLIVSAERTIVIPALDQRSIDFGSAPTKVLLRGLRVATTEAKRRGSPSPDFSSTIDRRIRGVVTEMRLPFAYGGRYYRLTGNLSSPIIASTVVGTRRQLELPSTPDPRSKIMGGARVGICIERKPDKAGIGLLFLDLGAVDASDPPDLTLDNGPIAESSVTVGFTLNAENDPVELQYALDPTKSITDPLTLADDEWKALQSPFSPLSDIDYYGMPSNTRVFVRGRSVPAAQGRDEAVSDWAYTVPEYVDTAAFTAPSGLAVSNIAGGSADYTFVTGTPGLSTQVMLKATASTSPLTDADEVKRLDPGVASGRLTNLAVSTTYRLAVRHVDENNGVTTENAVSFTTTGAQAVAPRPAGFAFVSGTGIVTLALYSSDDRFNWIIRRAPDSAGAPNLGAIETLETALPGGNQLYPDYPSRATSAVWWYDVAYSLPGYTDSPWVGWKSITLPLVPGDVTDVFPSPTMPSVVVTTARTSVLGTLTLTYTDPDSRTTAVQFQTVDSAGTESAWATDATPPYSTTVALVAGKTSIIRWRLQGYDARGVKDQILVQGQEAFAGPGAALGATYITKDDERATLANSLRLTSDDGSVVIVFNAGTPTPLGKADLSVAAAIAALEAFVALTDGATITWTVTGKREAKASVTLGGNRTLAFTGLANGSAGVLVVTQDGTGGRTLTLPAGSKIEGISGTAAPLSTAASKIDILAFEYDGTTLWWTFGKAFGG